jgi:hypothetical protein
LCAEESGEALCIAFHDRLLERTQAEALEIGSREVRTSKREILVDVADELMYCIAGPKASPMSTKLRAILEFEPS